MTFVRRGAAKVKHLARVRWLEANRDLIASVPGIHDDVTDAGRARLETVVEHMNALGLFGTSTPDTQREAVRRLVSEFRGERIGGAW